MTRKISAGMLSSVFMMLLLLACKRSVRLPCASSQRYQTSVFAEAVDMTIPRNTTRGLMMKSDVVSGKNVTMGQILRQAGRKGLGGGLPGAIAGVIQVFTLMGLRTVINYQMRYGTPFMKAIEVLYKEGGIARFYQGLGFALVQAPLSRFVSTGANDGVQAFLASFHATSGWGPGRTTMLGAIIVGIARVILMPIDTCKTVLQVDSRDGFRSLRRRLRAGHIRVLYQGACANAISSIMSHYPWFYTYNFLSSKDWLQQAIPSRLFQNAIVGLTSSVVSDTVANVFRVVKTTKQALGSKHDISYGDTVRMVLAADGWRGLFGRGLGTRLLANAVQSIVFTIIWRGLADSSGLRNQAPEDQAVRNSDKASIK